MLCGGPVSPAASVRAGGASGPPSNVARYPAIRSASGPLPDVTTTAVVESIVNVSAGVSSTDDGAGISAGVGWARAAAVGEGFGVGAVVGARAGRPHAAATTRSVPNADARNALPLGTVIGTSGHYFGVSPAASYNAFDSYTRPARTTRSVRRRSVMCSAGRPFTMARSATLPTAMLP